MKNPFSLIRGLTPDYFRCALTVAAVAALLKSPRSLADAKPNVSINNCNRQAVSLLKQYSPSGYDSYWITRDKNTFNEFSSDCRNQQNFLDSGLITAVHETNHVIRGEQNVYHLVSKELLPVPPAPNYFAPAALVPILSKNPKIRNDTHFQTYLKNTGADGSTSRDDFTYLLDEMNAFTSSLQAQADLARMHPITNRESGLPALMTFVAAYVSYAQTHNPGVWKNMTSSPSSPMRVAIGKLWSQAESTLLRACKIGKSSSDEDDVFIDFLCNSQQANSISMVIGRQSKCPSDCLNARRRSDESGTTSASAIVH